MMRVLVTGGRDYRDGATVRLALSSLPADAVLVHGAASGADTKAAEQWEAWGRKTEAHPAQWDRYGKAAGAIRNQIMLDTGVDLLVAFPGGRGTADMVSRCRKAGVPILFAADIPVVAGA